MTKPGFQRVSGGTEGCGCIRDKGAKPQYRNPAASVVEWDSRIPEIRRFDHDELSALSKFVVIFPYCQSLKPVWQQPECSQPLTSLIRAEHKWARQSDEGIGHTFNATGGVLAQLNIDTKVSPIPSSNCS